LLTIPTQLSALRILLTFLIIGLLLVPQVWARAAAFLGFLVAGATDWLDGFLARRLGQTSSFGALLDPLADKVLTLGLFVTFAALGWVRWWMVAVIAARELLVTGARLAAVRRRVVLAAAIEGKQKMISQVVSLILLFIVSTFALLGPERVPDRIYLPVVRLTALCLWVTVVLTVISGAVFFWRHRQVLSRVLG